MDIASTLGSAATGGVLGGIFSLGGAAVEYVNARATAKENLKQKEVDYAHELQVQDRAAERGRQEAQEGFAKSDMETHFATMQKAIEDQMNLTARVAGPVLDILALFRPGLTILLIVMAFAFGIMKLEEYFQHTIQLVAMAVAWWFGDRQRNKQLGVG